MTCSMRVKSRQPGRFGLGLILSFIVVSVMSQGRTWALTDEEVFRDFRFNFVNPGARALGMGGAFIAAGDDATAAQSNPAALHYVNTKEFFVEYRAVRPDTQVFAPTPIGPDPGTTVLDPVNNPMFLRLQSVNDRADTNFASFISFALPFKIGSRRATLALSRQIVLDVDTNLQNSSNGATGLQFGNSTYPTWVNSGGLSCDPLVGQVEQYTICNIVNGNLNAQLVHYNASLSYSFLDDFSIGLTATYATLHATSEVTNTTEDPLGVISTPNPRVIVAGVAAPLVTRTRIDDSDSKMAYTVGLHWHPDRAFASGYSPITFGLVYRKGADLSVKETRSDLSNPLTITSSSFTNTLREPDRYGFGSSYRTPRHWTFAADAERIKFSQLLKGYQTGVNFLTSQDLQASTGITLANPHFTVDDATVIHAGFEFRSRSRGGWGYALRSGYYDAPDNRIRLQSISVTLAGATPGTISAIESNYREAFKGGKKVNHATGGFSIISPGGFQMQFAADLADSGNEYLASAIYRFGKLR